MVLKKLFKGVLYNTIVGSMYAFPKLNHNIIYNGLENFSNQPPTLILSNHKRDADPMIIFPTLYYKKRFPKMHFVARADLFLQGLPGFQQGFNPTAGYILFYINMRKPVSLLNAHPIRKYETTTVRELLTDIKDNFGDYYIDDILTEKWGFLFNDLRPGENNKKLKISDVIKPHYNKVLKENYRGIAGFLKDGAFVKKVKDLEREIVNKQLEVFADILNNNGTLCLFPEGKLSEDGKLRYIKYGTYGILSQTKTKFTLLPINIVYDFMYTARRINTHINFGKEYTLETISTNESIDNFVEQELKNLTTITPSNLFSYYLCKVADENKNMPYTVIKKDNLEKKLFTAFNDLDKESYFIDKKVLNKKVFDKRLNGYLIFCSFFMNPFLNWKGNDIILDNNRISDGEVNYRKNPIKYCANEVSHFKVLEDIFN